MPNEFLEKDWFLKAIDKVKKDYDHKSDAELARFLGTSAAMLNHIRSGRSKPPNRLMFTVADKVGYLKTVEGISWLVTLVAGDDAGRVTRENILKMVSPKK